MTSWAPRVPVRRCDVPKLTKAQAEACAATPSWDEMTEQQRQEADRGHAEGNGFVYDGPGAQERAAQDPKRRRSPAASRSRQARSRRRTRAADADGDKADGDSGDGEDADGGDADGDNPAQGAALEWLRAGNGVLLLWWPVFGKDASVRCACGKANCASIGKHPI